MALMTQPLLSILALSLSQFAVLVLFTDPKTWTYLPLDSQARGGQPRDAYALFGVVRLWERLLKR